MRQAFATATRRAPLLDEATRWLDLLKTSFASARLPPYLGSRASRIIKVPKIYASDSGLAANLAGVHDVERSRAVLEHRWNMTAVHGSSGRDRAPDRDVSNRLASGAAMATWPRRGRGAGRVGTGIRGVIDGAKTYISPRW